MSNCLVQGLSTLLSGVEASLEDGATVQPSSPERQPRCGDADDVLALSPLELSLQSAQKATEEACELAKKLEPFSEWDRSLASITQSSLQKQASKLESAIDAELQNLPSNLSLEEVSLSSRSPLSSVASSSSFEDVASMLEDKSSVSSEETPQLSATGTRQNGIAFCESEDENVAGKSEKAIKLPQRKGGMQLWQFLYTLLSDPNKKYSELIEWTSNIKEREFRLHEPECIAIWWGDHKNKRNMSYDKLSRSLRYYYDKGIIRKINGQRYVYRFCVDPEVMYRHIGNSDCRPKLKPMSQAARSAMSKYNHTYWGMLCPPHSATPNAAFTMPNGHILPPQYPVLTPSCMLPSSAFDQSYGIPVHDKLNPIDGQLYPEGPGTRQFQQQHLSLMGHCQNDSANYNFSHQKPFPTNYQECTLALTVEGAHFENVCSPQMHSPLAPVSHPSPTMLHRSYSPPLPPPYPFDYGSNNCDN